MRLRANKWVWSLRSYNKIAFLSLRTGSYFKIWFLNRRKKELITQTITCNFASVTDGRTRGSVHGCSVGYHVMGGVCSIDLQCCGVKNFQCGVFSGVVQNVTNLRSGHKGHQCALV